MLNGTSIISVPAGNIEVMTAHERNIRTYRVPYYGYLRLRNFHYAKNVGFINGITYFQSGVENIEFSLVSYNLN